MANTHATLTDLFTDIADAIRSKTGESGTIVADAFPEAIEAISAGVTAGSIVAIEFENATPFVAPKGRMKGDVDGDGKITIADVNRIGSHTNSADPITDEIQFWCADVNNDGRVVTADRAVLNGYIAGNQSPLTATPTMADYYGNWTWFKIDKLSGYFYYDVAVEGMTAGSSAIVVASVDSDCFTEVECGAGFARIKAQRLPIEDSDCYVFWKN